MQWLLARFSYMREGDVKQMINYRQPYLLLHYENFVSNNRKVKQTMF